MNRIYTHHLYAVNNYEDFLSFLSNYQITFLSENCFSVKDAEGKYLTAFPNGEVGFHADEISFEEKFYILDDEVLKFIQESINGSYKDSLGQEISSFKSFLGNNKIHILLGNDLITPSFIPPGRFSKKNNGLNYTTLDKIFSVFKPKPLIYFCVYGQKEEYFECLYLAIKSLIEKGEYTGDILIKTEADKIDEVTAFAEQFSNKFHYSAIDPKLGIFNRFWLHEDYLSNYSSIIYFDSDILTCHPVDKVLKHLSIGDFASSVDMNKDVAKEAQKLRDGEWADKNWYGLQYLSQKKIQSNDILILNSGLYSINNLSIIKPLFDKILQYKFLEDRFGDQPYMNLVLYNSGADIRTINESNELAFAWSLYEAFSNIDKTLIHFNSGVGNTTKLILMKETWMHITG